MNEMRFEDIAMDVVKKWKNELEYPIDKLQKRLFSEIREVVFGYDDNKFISNLVASETPSSRHYAVNRSMPIILGIQSDSKIDYQLEIGGSMVGEVVHLEPNVSHPILVDKNNIGWPLVQPDYHEIKIIGDIPKDAKIYIIGVVLRKDILNKIFDTRIPNIICTKSGMCTPDTHEFDINTWLPLE